MAAMTEVWESAKAAITAYTGLSPVAFLATLAMAVALYHVVSGMFLKPAPPPAPAPAAVQKSEAEFEPLPPPVQLGEVTEEELKEYDGTDPNKPLLMAIKGQIYDVTQSRMFYGPGGPYALFAGKDASRALAKMSFEPNDLTSDISGLGPFEMEALQEWEYKFMSKYVKVGSTKKTVPVTEEPANAEASERAADTDNTASNEKDASESKENGTSHEDVEPKTQE